MKKNPRDVNTIMSLKVHDNRRRQKVEFTTIEPGKVKMYVCGVTVYDLCHLGHARCYIAFDLIHRWLEKSGYQVQYIQNFTDIEDKIINRANETGIGWEKLVEDNIAAYYQDMDALNILRADEYPRCTEYVKEMIDIIQLQHKNISDLQEALQILADQNKLINDMQRALSDVASNQEERINLLESKSGSTD